VCVNLGEERRNMPPFGAKRTSIDAINVERNFLRAEMSLLTGRKLEKDQQCRDQKHQRVEAGWKQVVTDRLQCSITLG
jgi:hypothetical protein